MAVRASDTVAAADVGTDARLVGPDVVRAVAMVGVVVMNFHGYLILRGGQPGDGALARFFDPWTGPLATRFAATFVLVAGVGVTLLTRRAVGPPAQPDLVRDRRWTLVRRGLALYAFGLLFDAAWPGTILPYYGVMFVVAALVFTWRGRWVVAVGAAAAVAAAGLAWWRIERSLGGHDTSWLFAPSGSSPRHLLFDVVVDGTHPVLPWLAFFCAGIVLGRVLRTDWWRAAAIGGGLTLYGLATAIAGAGPSDPRAAVLASDDPWDRGLLYTLSALGTALVGFGVVTWLAERFRGSRTVQLLRHAGAMSLTVYIAHAVVFDVLVDRAEWIRPGGLGTALGFAAVFWVAAIPLAAWWHRRAGIGPAERVYRRLGG